MTTPITKTVQTTIETKVCLGHESHVKKCFTREEVRQESTKVLGEYAKKATVLSSKTHMVEATEKRKLLGSKKVYDLYITYFHKNNQAPCNHFQIRNDRVSNQVPLEEDAISNDIFFDVKEGPLEAQDAIDAIRHDLLTVLPELNEAATS